MLPSTSDPKWRDLLTGKIRHSFNVVSASLLVSRLNRQTKADRNEEYLDKYINEAHAFFEKYQKILEDDISAIFG